MFSAHGKHRAPTTQKIGSRLIIYLCLPLIELRQVTRQYGHLQFLQLTERQTPGKLEKLTHLIEARLLVGRFAQWDDEAMPDKEEVCFELEPYSTGDEACHDAGQRPA